MLKGNYFDGYITLHFTPYEFNIIRKLINNYDSLNPVHIESVEDLNKFSSDIETLYYNGVVVEDE